MREILVLFLLSIIAPAAERPQAPWPPAEGDRIPLIVDADAANEVDDQFALALALGARDRLDLVGFVAAHFGLRGGPEGIQKSHDEMLRVLDMAGREGEFPVLRGSDPLVYLEAPPESEGVDFIIQEARKATPENPLWLVLLGPATDAASALLQAPDIADRLVVFWHGRTRWPVQCWNFNAYNDIKAVQVIFEKPCRLVLFDTGTYLRIPTEESERRLVPTGPLGSYLHEIRMEKEWHRSPRKGFFDLGDIVALVKPAATAWEIVDAPRINHDLHYDFSKDYGPIVRIYHVDRDQSVDLLEAALYKIEREKMAGRR